MIALQKLPQRLKGYEWAALLLRRNADQVRFANNQVISNKSKLEQSLSLLLVKQNRVFTACITGLLPSHLDALLQCIKQALSVVKIATHAPKLAEPKAYKPIESKRDKKPSAEQLIDRVEEAIQHGLKHGAQRIAGTLNCIHNSVQLWTSTGIRAKHEHAYYTLEVRALIGKDASGMGVSCESTFKQLDSEAASSQAAELAKLSRKAVKGKGGKYLTVLGRPAAAVLWDWFGFQCSAFCVDAGLSCLAGKVGQVVGSRKLEVCDDGRLAHGLASRPFDDEGYATGRNVLIKEGKLCTYLHNSTTAQRYSTLTTANAGWIAPHPWNLVIGEGELRDEELLAEVRKGIYVHNLGYLRFHDFKRGDFSAVLRDGVFEVKGGELCRAIKGLRMSDNFLNCLQNVQALSKPALPTLHWWMEHSVPVYTPMLLTKLNFTALNR